jgi:hypothetical protein
MKRFILSVVFALTLPGYNAGVAAGLHQVYVLPMAGGLDQYIADWITRDKIMQVVTDPKVADLVMTDRLGEAFEQKLAQIRPPAPMPVEKSAEKKDDKKDDGKSSKSGGAGAPSDTPHSFQSTSARGTLFLVDIKSRQVIWSDHEKPPTVSDSNLSREAERVAKKLQETFGK